MYSWKCTRVDCLPHGYEDRGILFVFCVYVKGEIGVDAPNIEIIHLITYPIELTQNIRLSEIPISLCQYCSNPYARNNLCTISDFLMVARRVSYYTCLAAFPQIWVKKQSTLGVLPRGKFSRLASLTCKISHEEMGVFYFIDNVCPCVARCTS